MPAGTAEDTIRPRLEAAQADLARIQTIRCKACDDRPHRDSRRLPLLEQRIAERQARLLVIDPLMAFLYGAYNNKDQEIRRLLFKLSRIAEKHRCAIVCMSQLNKGGGQKAIYRGNSSIGVIGHARVGRARRRRSR
jgi:DNA repair protein RadA/Sms